MTPIKRIVLSIPFVAVLASCATDQMADRPAPLINLAGAGASNGFIAPTYDTIANPMSKDGRRMSVFLTTKFVELETKQFKKHETFGDLTFQTKIRRLMQMKGADLMTAPSMVTTTGKRAKVEIIREMKLKGEAFDETMNLGVTLEVEPAILKNGRIHLSGKSTVREVDSSEVAFGDNAAVSVQSSATYFDVTLKPGQTAQLIMRDSGVPGQLVVFVTAQLIDGDGSAAAKLAR